jgi:hypothetical protein
MHCSHCDELAPATRLNWDELTDQRSWVGGRDLNKGAWESLLAQ